MKSKNFDKSVPFHDLLKRLKLKKNASDGVIKKDNVNTISLHIFMSNNIRNIH